MKLLKNIVLSLFIAASTIGFSSIASAAAIDDVFSKIAEAEKAFDDGAAPADIISIIRDAARKAKDVPAGDNVDTKRQRASGFLKKSRLAVKKGKMDDAKAHLQEAKKRFTVVKGLL